MAGSIIDMGNRGNDKLGTIKWKIQKSCRVSQKEEKTILHGWLTVFPQM